MRIPPEAWSAQRIGEADIKPPAAPVLLDTMVLGTLYRHRQQPASAWTRWFNGLPRAQRIVSDVVLWEFRRNYHGAEVREWVGRYFVVEPVPSEALPEFRRLLQFVFVHGRRLPGVADGLLIAHALAARRTIVTDNTDDFCAVPRVRLYCGPPLF